MPQARSVTASAQCVQLLQMRQASKQQRRFAVHHDAPCKNLLPKLQLSLPNAQIRAYSCMH